MKQQEMEVKIPVYSTTDCNRVRGKNARGTLIKCRGKVICQSSVSSDFLVGKCLTCSYTHGKKVG